MDCLELKIPVALKYLPLAMGFVKECAKSFGFEEELTLNEIEVAAEEAVSNAVCHACPTEDDSAVTVLCRKIPAGMEILIRDRGIPFDPERTPQFDPSMLQSEWNARGLGMFLMREIMDEVTYRNLGRDGKEVQLVKYFKRQPREDLFVTPEGGGGSFRSLLKGRKRTGYEVRMFEPDDALEVTRCAYLMHGYTFYDDEVYYPETLVELHLGGKMIAAVAVTPDREVALFNALIRREVDSPTAEMTFVLVNPTIRAPGALEKVGWFLLDGQRNWLKGVTSAVAASHTLTQSVMAKNGFVPCAIYICVDAADWKFHFLNNQNQSKNPISNVNFFMFLEQPSPQILYPPLRHREMIGKIYQWLSVDQQFAEPGNGCDLGSLCPHARMQTQIIESEKSACLTVMEYGRDLARHVEGSVRECRNRDIRFVELRLPLNQPGTFSQTEEMERLGFFFSGILPMGKHGDYLLLQMPSEWDIDYGAIKVASEQGQFLLEYVRECEKQRHADN